MSNVINFPGLGLSFNPPEVAFTVLGHDIRWYGIIIAFGFMLAFLYGMKRCEQFGYNQDQLIDILFVATPVAIICARAYYVILTMTRPTRFAPASTFSMGSPAAATC
jgi:phosphatidylglycerol:prolipoprotein diacylglycerol transferase